MYVYTHIYIYNIYITITQIQEFKHVANTTRPDSCRVVTASLNVLTSGSDGLFFACAQHTFLKLKGDKMTGQGSTYK